MSTKYAILSLLSKTNISKLRKKFFMLSHHTFIKRSFLSGAFLLSVLTFNGCNPSSTAQDPITATEIKLNTAVTITIYDSDDTDLLTECMALCDKYEKIFSRTDADSELYKLNHRELTAVNGTADTFQLSEPLTELIQTGLSYCELSEGAFDIAIEPLTSLWDFTSDDPEVPSDSLIQEALPLCDYCDITFSETNPDQVTLKTAETAIELGAIAKGYIADRLKEYLLSQDVHSAIINLGGNVLCIGSKPDGTPFKIGIQKPFADRSETIAVMDITDKSVVSSGVYERCFEQDGILYHHLLDPKTGYPYANDLIAVTIISDKSVDGDALSTSCFALGLEKGLELADSLDGVEAFFVNSDYEIYYTKDFQKNISVTETNTQTVS